MKSRHIPDVAFRTAEDLLPFVQSMRVRDHEIVRAFLVSGKGRLLRWVTIQRGNGHRALLYPPHLFRPAILARARGIYLVHNHPGQQVPEPSPRDIEVTRRLALAGSDLLDIEILDHLIVGETGHTSLRERGLI